MWPIVRDAFAGASAATRVQLRWIAVSWIVLFALQVWDSRDGRGASGVAEFLSAVFGMTGLALLGLAHGLQQAMAEAASRKEHSRNPALQEVLIALPVLGFAAGALLSAATVLMLLRALLGAELPLAIVGIAIYGGLLVVAQRTVARSTRTLFAHASHNATLAAEARSDAAAAQIQALQARMNPHFLFNALNTVASLVRSNPRAAERVVQDLSDVLRHVLSSVPPARRARFATKWSTSARISRSSSSAGAIGCAWSGTSMRRRCRPNYRRSSCSRWLRTL